MPKVLKPKGDRIIIKRYSPEERTKGGIILPGVAKDKKQDYGEVLAVGPEAEECVKPGEVVVFANYAGNAVELEDREEHFVVRQDDILASVEERDA